MCSQHIDNPGCFILVRLIDAIEQSDEQLQSIVVSGSVKNLVEMMDQTTLLHQLALQLSNIHLVDFRKKLQKQVGITLRMVAVEELSN